MENNGRYHIPALLSRDFFAEGFTVVPNIFIKYSHRLGLKTTDIMIMFAFFYFQQQGRYELAMADFVQFLHLPEGEIQISIDKMRDLGVLTDNEHVLDTKGLFEKLADFWAEEKVQDEQNKQHHASLAFQLKQSSTPLTKTINLFEREFGRALTPIEIDKINNWHYDQGYTDTLIKEALKRAVLRGILNMNYIDKILASWAKMNIRTTREIMEYEEKFHDKKKQVKQPKTGIIERHDEKFKDIYLT